MPSKLEQKLKVLGGKPAEAWARIEAARREMPEKGSGEALQLIAARKAIDKVVELLGDDTLEAEWLQVQQSLRESPAKADKGLRLSEAEVARFQRYLQVAQAHLEMAQEHHQYIADVLAGKSPVVPRAKKAVKGVPPELDAKSAAALGLRPKKGAPVEPAAGAGD